MKEKFLAWLRSQKLGGCLKKGRFVEWLLGLGPEDRLKIGKVLVVEKPISWGLYYGLFPHMLSWGRMTLFLVGYFCVVGALVVFYDHVLGRNDHATEPTGDPLGVRIFRGMYTPNSFRERMSAQIIVLDQLDPLFAFLIFRKEDGRFGVGGVLRLIWYIAITTAYWTVVNLGFWFIFYGFFTFLYR